MFSHTEKLKSETIITESLFKMNVDYLLLFLFSH